jgi:hypothetical protein
MGLPAFLELEGVAHDPTQDRARDNAYSHLPRPFGEVALAELHSACDQQPEGVHQNVALAALCASNPRMPLRSVVFTD